jgi:hypothetical protein
VQISTTRRFIPVFKRVLYWSLSGARSIQSLSPTSTITYVLVFLVVYYRLVFPPIAYTHSSSLLFVLYDLPSHPTLLGHSNYSWLRSEAIQLLIMQVFTISYYFIHPAVCIKERKIFRKEMSTFCYSGSNKRNDKLIIMGGTVVANVLSERVQREVREISLPAFIGSNVTIYFFFVT